MSDQVKFWKGDQGNDYIKRNTEQDLLMSYIVMWSRIFSRLDGVKDVCEVGANIGINLQAISSLKPNTNLYAIEPNEKARDVLRAKGVVAFPLTAECHWGEIGNFDLVFTRGVLIHIRPDALPEVYENLYRHSKRYIVITEYFDPNRTMINYRGEDDRLWKADFAGEMMARYPDLHLVDYFFTYSNDTVAPQDNVTTFILEKR